MDGSDCSRRALNHAIQLGEAYDGRLDIVHFTDMQTDTTAELLERIDDRLSETDLEYDVEVRTDTRLSDPRSSTHIGRLILEMVENREPDLVIMGHHGTGIVGELILGSTAKTVVEAGEIPVTVVP